MADSTLVSRLLDLRSDPWPPDTRLSSESHARDALVSTVESLEHRLPQTDWYHDPALEERHTINLTEVISVVEIFPQLQPQQLSIRRKPISDLICQKFHHLVARETRDGLVCRPRRRLDSVVVGELSDAAPFLASGVEEG